MAQSNHRRQVGSFIMVQLSFIVCTRNRLPYLKILFAAFFKELLPGEEVVVVDGNSTDGSQEFLESLVKEGRIHQYISEADRNQAQGWNKGLLMAKGRFIKKIMDDDVFCLESIRYCTAYMEKDPSVSVCIANSLHAHLLRPESIEQSGRLDYFMQWKKGYTRAFTFSDADMLIRRSVLSLTGLFDTSFVMLDWEFSLRCSYLQLKFVYYTGYLCLSATTPGNVSATTSAEVKRREKRIGRVKYGYPGDGADISLFSKLKIAVGKALATKAPAIPAPLPTAAQTVQIYEKWYAELNSRNAASEKTFIT